MYCFPARPCAKDGTFLRHPILKPEPAHPPDSTPDNPWAPFEDRIAFEWAYERYVELQASKRQIKQGLDLWSAILLKGKSKSEVPWKSAEQLYDTIDSIEAGNAPWSTYELRYNGPKPTGAVPCWMQETYELNTCDVLRVVELQLANPEFDGRFDYSPYKEYGPDGHRLWSNLMSGDWAHQEAVTILYLFNLGLC